MHNVEKIAKAIFGAEKTRKFKDWSECIPLANAAILAFSDEITQENVRLRSEIVSNYADAQRIINWLENPKRKPAISSFTESNERQIAYRVESLIFKEKGN